MEIGYHHQPPLLSSNFPFERKAPFLKTEASPRFCFQELLLSHETNTERQLSIIQNTGPQAKKTPNPTN